jgi:carboxypeptidase Taq
MPRTAEQAYAELLRRTRETALLHSCAGVLGWDERTYMPREASAHRSEQMALLARMGHESATAPEVGELLGQLESSSYCREVDSIPVANIREIRRTYNRLVKLPKELVEELARVATRAQQVWQDARQANDFARFRPWLEKIIALKRQEAQAIGYKHVPYDALLDEYEPGATTAQIAKVFAALREELVPLVGAILDSGRAQRRDILEREYPVEQQRLFGEQTAAAIGFDFNAGRLDVTTHPFCSRIGPGDCRITTRYHPHRFNEAFFGIIHEAGHGIYDQGLDPAHYGAPAGQAASLGIHESQSRLWENQVGRGRPFWEHFFPIAQRTFPSALGDIALDDFFFAVNDVRRSFIRVEADEATYNMHIILRFELEQALIAGDLQPADVPGAWNERFQKSFSLNPVCDADGCLQDIHWSMGGIGYFPTYTLGNLYAAQFMDQARQDLGYLDADFRRGQFGRFKTWLNEKVHRPGHQYVAENLCRRVTGAPLSHKPLIAYLRTKYTPLYHLSA